MTELKTLKDLQEDPIVMRHCNWVVSSLQLKSEAINWIKKDRSICKDCEFLLDCKNNHPFCWRCKVWMKRFNITEEDLLANSEPKMEDKDER